MLLLVIVELEISFESNVAQSEVNSAILQTIQSYDFDVDKIKADQFKE